MTDNSEYLPVNTNFYVEVARGRVRGASVVHKFGVASDIDTGDNVVNVWDGMSLDNDTGKIQTYTYSDTDDIRYVSSSQAGTDCVVTVEGLDVNWDYVIQDVQLDGQNPVALTVPLLRVFRAYINCSFGLNTGEFFYVYTGGSLTGGTPDTTTNVRAIVSADRGQTQMAMYTVPRGYRLYITRGWATAAGRINGTSILYIRVRSKDRVWRQLHITALKGNASSSAMRPYEIPLILESQQDLEYLVDTDTNDAAVSAGFHAVLLREDYANSKPIITYSI